MDRNLQDIDVNGYQTIAKAFLVLVVSHSISALPHRDLFFLLLEYALTINERKANIKWINDLVLLHKSIQILENKIKRGRQQWIYLKQPRRGRREEHPVTLVVVLWRRLDRWGRDLKNAAVRL